MKSATAFIGVGSNLGDRLAFCRQAVALLRADASIELKAVSPLYETAPVDFIEQGRFYNAVLKIGTVLLPEILLEHCQEIEQRLGKNILRPKGPRTLDLDLLFYEKNIFQTEHLTLPHPEVENRAFVLLPLSTLAPDLLHPSLFLSIQALCARLSESQQKGVQKYLETGWEKDEGSMGCFK